MTQVLEGTPQQIVKKIERLSSKRRYRVVEVEEPVVQENTSIETMNQESIALLQSWIADAPTSPEAIREAEEDLLELKRNLNLPRKQTGARLHFPEVE